MIKTAVDSTCYPFTFNTVLINNNEKGIILRNSCKSESEIKLWLSQYEEESKTNWIVKYKLMEPERLLYHKTWVCHHSNRNKLSLKYKNTGCKCTLDVKIKKLNRNTIKNDKFLKLKEPLCCTIMIGSFHNHHLGIPSSLKYLKISPEVKNTFENYFNMGMTAACAVRHHENQLLMKEAVVEGKITTDDSSLNPKIDCVAHLYKDWKKRQFGGDDINPLNSLRERLKELEERGAKIGIREDGDLWSVLVVTPVMKRNQKEPLSKEGVYVDTSASCDVAQSNVTVLSTITKAGAIPIGILIHSHQTTESYIQAFSLLRDECPIAFGGNESPLTCMTDDSSAERTALKEVWPNVTLLLCHFHLLQAEWRWLLSNVNKEDRQELMINFKAVLYADTQDKFEAAVQTIEEKASKFSKFHKRFLHQLERKQDWVLLFRLPLLTRNNNTNNYSEASFRILKDVVLNRTKAFNVVALAICFIDVWDPYFVARLSKIAFGRGAAQILLYDKLFKSASYLNTCAIKKISETEYSLPSSDSKSVYTVNIDVGQCTCFSGRQGGFCKHQCWLLTHLKISLPYAPTTTTNDRWMLGKLARGDTCPPRSYFLDLQEQDIPVTAVQTAESEECVTFISEANVDAVCNQVNDLETTDGLFHDDKSETEDEDAVLNSATEEFQRVLALVKGNTSGLKITHNMIASLKKIKTPNQAIETLLALKNSVKGTIRRGGKLRVQPTSIARRREGLPRGSKTVPRGRPSAVEVRKRGLKKRPRNLNSAIQNNVANAKSH